MLCGPAWWRGAEHTLGRPRERATGVHQHFHGPRGPERERVHLVTEGSLTAMSPAGSANVSHHRHSPWGQGAGCAGCSSMSIDAQVSDAHHPGHEIVRSTCGNRVNPGQAPGHGQARSSIMPVTCGNEPPWGVGPQAGPGSDDTANSHSPCRRAACPGAGAAVPVALHVHGCRGWCPTVGPASGCRGCSRR
jgi:hypothetical protein